MFHTECRYPKAASGYHTDVSRQPAADEAMLRRWQAPLVVKRIQDVYAEWTDAELTRATLRLTQSERWAHTVLINVLHEYFRAIPDTEKKLN